MTSRPHQTTRPTTDFPCASPVCARPGPRGSHIGAGVLSGAISIAAGFLQPSPLATAALFVCAALGATALDALGNIPFLRAVRHYERSEMTSVFRPSIDASKLLPPAAYAVVLPVAPVPAVFCSEEQHAG